MSVSGLAIAEFEKSISQKVILTILIGRGTRIVVRVLCIGKVECRPNRDAQTIKAALRRAAQNHGEFPRRASGSSVEGTRGLIRSDAAANSTSRSRGNESAHLEFAEKTTEEFTGERLERDRRARNAPPPDRGRVSTPVRLPTSTANPRAPLPRAGRPDRRHKEVNDATRRQRGWFVILFDYVQRLRFNEHRNIFRTFGDDRTTGDFAREAESFLSDIR